jgi:hypothetical protein
MGFMNALGCGWEVSVFCSDGIGRMTVVRSSARSFK